ncbi:MAG TPA: DUF4432 family protein [Planctomycetes bacterium]|nr:DUF4432 family protein [Planctomycetota bacterium]
MRRPETKNRGARVTRADINGMRCLFIENSLIRLRINLDLGADIVEFVYKPSDVDAMWRSPLPEIPFSRAAGPVKTEQGFLYYYEGGWQELFPHASRAEDAYGAALPMHGEAWSLSWEYRIQKDTPEEVVVAMWCSTRMLPFMLLRRLRIQEGEAFVTLEERVENTGTEHVSFIWGHHPAFGEPFLEEGCLLSASGDTLYDGKNETPWPPPEDGIVFTRIPPKSSGKGAMVYILDLKEGLYEITNPRRQLTFRMTWDKEVFPYIWVWQEFGSNKGYPWFGRAYAMAVEPVSSLPFARSEGGRMLSLAGGASIETALTAGFVA